MAGVSKTTPEEDYGAPLKDTDEFRYSKETLGLYPSKRAFMSDIKDYIGFPPSIVLTGKIVYVDAVYGDDTTGTREDFVNSFATIAAAKAVLQSGDLLYVRPGSYTATAADSFLMGSTNRMYCEPGVILTSAFTTTPLKNLYGYADIVGVILSIQGIVYYNTITTTNEIELYFPNNLELYGGNITITCTGTPRGLRIEGTTGTLRFNIGNIIYTQTGGMSSPTAWGALCINNVSGVNIKGTLNNILLSGNANNIAGITILDGVVANYDSNIDITFNSIIGDSSLTGTLLMGGIYVQNVLAPINSSSLNINGNLIDVSATTVMDGVKVQSGTVEGIRVKKVIANTGTALQVGDDGGGLSNVNFYGDLQQLGDNTQHVAAYVYHGSTLNFFGDTKTKFNQMFAICDSSTLNIFSGEILDTGNHQTQAIQMKNNFSAAPKLNMGDCKVSKLGANSNIVLLTTDSVAFFKGTNLFNISGTGGTSKSVLSGGATNISLLSLYSNVPLDGAITNTTTGTTFGKY